MKRLVSQFTFEVLFISFISFFAVAARLIILIGQWKLIVPANFRVALFAELMNVKRVCLVTKLVKLHFTSIIFIKFLKHELLMFLEFLISWGSAMISFSAK